MEVYRFPFEWNESCGFNPLWKYVKDVCTLIFSMIKTKPDNNIRQNYLKLCSELSIAHALVYRLISNECTECPLLYRNNEVRVQGDKPESTQVLVLYYILREALKLHVANIKSSIKDNENIINAYLDTFEQFTAALNVIKALFIYLQWVWQKRGLPPEHIILPTELVGLHLWSGTILSVNIHDELANRASKIINETRTNCIFNIDEMESVKRLSLVLAMLSEIHESQYASIIEQRYLLEMLAYYSSLKSNFKKLNEKIYLINCFNELQKEEQRARFFLHPTSYDQVSYKLTELFIKQERETLMELASNWLTLYKHQISHLEEESLFALYQLLGKINDRKELLKLISKKVREHGYLLIQEQLSHTQIENNSNSLWYVEKCLDIIKECYVTYRSLIITVFEWTSGVERAFLHGIRLILNDIKKCDEHGNITFTDNNISDAVVEEFITDNNTSTYEHSAEENSTQNISSFNAYNNELTENNVKVHNSSLSNESCSSLYLDMIKVLAKIMIADIANNSRNKNSISSYNGSRCNSNNKNNNDYKEWENGQENQINNNTSNTNLICEKYDWSIIVFILLDNKDHFYTAYITLLQQRLLDLITNFNVTGLKTLNNTCYEHEQMLVTTIFKHGKNVEFASLCTRMLQDLYVHSLKQIKHFAHDIPGFFPFVLSKYAWHTLSTPTANEINAMPNSLRNKINYFISFHFNSRSGVGRRLRFAPEHSIAIMRLQVREFNKSHTPNANLKRTTIAATATATATATTNNYIRIVMTCRQMLVAVAFNEHRSWTLDKLSQHCNMSEDECLQIINEFIKVGIVCATLGVFTLDVEQIKRIQQPVLSLLQTSHNDTRLNRKLINEINNYSKATITSTTTFNSSNTITSIIRTKEQRRVIEAQIMYFLKQNKSQTLNQIHHKMIHSTKNSSLSISLLKSIIEDLIEKDYVENDSSKGTFNYKP